MNVRADYPFGKFLTATPQETLGHPFPASSHFPTMEVSLHIGKTGIHSSISHGMILARIQEENYEDFFPTKHNIQFPYRMITWTAFSQAFFSKRGLERIMLSKFVHRWLPTGARAKSTHNQRSL